jgi:hypothetical protein
VKRWLKDFLLAHWLGSVAFSITYLIGLHATAVRAGDHSWSVVLAILLVAPLVPLAIATSMVLVWHAGFTAMLWRIGLLQWELAAWAVYLAIFFLTWRTVAKRSLIRQRTRAGQCVACGYDTRATPERCPECGTVLKVPG